jgi:hypothetical protein
MKIKQYQVKKYNKLLHCKMNFQSKFYIRMIMILNKVILKKYFTLITFKKNKRNFLKLDLKKKRL